jgi:hypothetical protein
MLILIFEGLNVMIENYLDNTVITDRLNLSYKDFKLNFDRYDKYAMYLSYLSFTHNDSTFSSRQVILHPTGLYLTMIYAATLPILMLKSDIENASNDMTKILMENDKVKYNGCLGEYLGIETIDSAALGGEVKRIVIAFNDTKVFLPIENAWKINKYEGEAVNLNNYKAKSNHKLEMSKNIIAQILDLNEKEIPLVAKSKILIVMDKKYLSTIFSDLFLNDMPLSSVFPVGYHVTTKKFDRIGVDTLQRKPMIVFVSNLATAEDIACSDNDVNIMLIYGIKKIKQNFVNLDNLASNTRIKNISIILDTHEFDSDELAGLKSMGFKFNTILPENICKTEVHKLYNNDNFFSKNKVAFEMLSQLKVEVIEVENETEQIILNINKTLSEIRRAHFESENKLTFIKKAYKILHHLKIFPVPLTFQEGFEIYNEIMQAPEDLEDLLLGMYTNVEKEFFLEMKQMVNEVRNLINFHLECHPKERIFLDLTISEDNHNVYVIIANTNQKEILKQILKNKQINCLTLNELMNSNELIENAIFTGWYGKKTAKILLKAGIKKLSFICYKYEKDWLTINQSEQQRALKNLKDTDLQQDSISLKEEHSGTEDYWTFEQDLLNIINDFSLSDISGSFGNNEPVGKVDAYPVEFEEDWIAFLSEGYRCRCIDREDEAIIIKRLPELEEGDEVIFVKDSSEDIFDRVIEKVKETSPEINEQMNLTRLWKNALATYKNLFGYSYVDIQTHLNNKGCKRTTQTIRWWLTDDCIGPEDDVLDVIAKMVGDTELNEKLEMVKQACRKVRNLHVQIGRYLAQAIISSLADNDENKFFKGITEDLTNHAQTAVVKKIHITSVNVPWSKTNKLIFK